MLVRYIIFLICFLISSPAKSSDNVEFDLDNLMPTLAVKHCKHLKNADQQKLDRALEVALIVYDVERKIGIPDEMRGMSLASACFL